MRSHSCHITSINSMPQNSHASTYVLFSFRFTTAFADEKLDLKLYDRVIIRFMVRKRVLRRPKIAMLVRGQTVHYSSGIRCVSLSELASVIVPCNLSGRRHVMFQ